MLFLSLSLCTRVFRCRCRGPVCASIKINGASQQEGVDYDQTYSSTLRHSSVRVLIAIQARLRLKSCQHDLVAAFLQGSLFSTTRLSS